MSSENVDIVVGLIAIESMSDQGLDRGADVECDGTLGEFLIQLASDGFGAHKPFETSGVGCLLAASDRFGGSARLSARLENLAAELEFAVAHVRRKIAAALQSAA
jgi:hypothetical protein